MKILVKDGSSEKKTLVKSFKYLNHNVALWGGPTSAFDVFDSFEPDLFLCDINQIDNDIIKCLKERPYLKSLVKTNTLVENNDGLNIVFYSSFIKEYPIIKNSADIFLKPVQPIEADICYVGPQDVRLKPLVNICSDFKYNIKIFGDGWRLPQCCGFSTDFTDNIKSGSKINIVLNEESASSELFNNYFRGIFTITTPCDIPHISFNDNNFNSLIDFYIENEKERKNKILEFKEFAMKNTCIDRAKELLAL